MCITWTRKIDKLKRRFGTPDEPTTFVEARKRLGLPYPHFGTIDYAEFVRNGSDHPPDYVRRQIKVWGINL